ncbi:MAG TPA: hypothetical protein VGW76_12780 [Pyrinomonadaceae bacterium]|nr:hypothetical protein [Pyrinomonadaceae bacterium]
MVALAAGIPLTVAEKVIGKEALASSNGLGSLGLSKAAFKAQLNTEFLVNDGTAKRKVRLLAVEDLSQSNKFGNGKEGFTLLFRGDQTSKLVQNTYFIEHARLGSFSFLLVPILARDKSATQYEAIINHLHP